MANNLHFEYHLSVDEKATKNSLDSFIRKTFGDGRNTKLSVPIKLDIANSISDIDFDKVQKEIDKKVKSGLKVKAKVEIDVANIKNQVQRQIAKIDKDLKFKVGLEIDPSAVKTMTGTIDVMQTLNKEIDKIKNNMRELGKNLTINIGNVEVKGQYDDLLKTSQKANEENKKTEQSLEEQLRTQKAILQTKEEEMKQLKKEIASEKERLEIAKERKATNDELIQQEKDLRKEASKIDEQIKAEQEKQKLYETQNASLKEQAKTQQQLADDLKKTNEEISKLETDRTASEARLQTAKEEEQRRLNNISLMKEENQLLKQKIADLEKMASVADGATSGQTQNGRKSISLKALSDETAKQTEEVAKKRIEQEQEVTSIMEKQSQQQRESIEKQIKAEGDLANAKLKTVKVVRATAKDELYNRVQSSEIAKAIHDERVEGVRTLEEEMAHMERLGEMVAKERGLLEQANELLSQRGNITEENMAKAKELTTALKDELTLIQEAAGVRPSVDKGKFKKALNDYNANPTPENLASLEFQAEKLGKIGAMYEYLKKAKKALKDVQKAYNVEAERSLEIEQKQIGITNKRNERATNMKTKEIYNKESKKERKYKDAGSYVTEEMYGFSATQLADALSDYDDVLEKYYAKDSFDVDYRKTDAAIKDGTKKIAEYTEKMKEATDETRINKYANAIESLNAKILDLKKSVNTYQELSTMIKAKEEGTYDFGAQTTSSSNKSSDDDTVVVYEGKVKQLKELTEQFIRYALGMQTVQNQAVDLKIKFGWLTKEFDNLIAKKSVDEDSWAKLADGIEEFKATVGVTTEEVEEYIATIKNKMNAEQQQAQQAKEQREQEIAKGNELKEALQAQMRLIDTNSEAYKKCKDALNDYSKAVKHNLSLTERLENMGGLVENMKSINASGESVTNVDGATTAIQNQAKARKARKTEIIQELLAMQKEREEAKKTQEATEEASKSLDKLSQSTKKYNETTSQSNMGKVVDDSNKALNAQKELNETTGKLDVKEKIEDFKTLYKTVASGEGTLEQVNTLYKMMQDELAKTNQEFFNGVGYTKDQKTALFQQAQQLKENIASLETMIKVWDRANEGYITSVNEINRYTDALRDNYNAQYGGSDYIATANALEVKAIDLANEKAKALGSTTDAIKEQSKALDAMAGTVGFTSEEAEALVKHIQELAQSGKNLTKTEMNKMSKTFQTPELASALDRRGELTARGRSSANGVRYSSTDEYKAYKAQIDATVASATASMHELFQQMYAEAKKMDALAKSTVQNVEKAKTGGNSEVSDVKEVIKATEQQLASKKELGNIINDVESKHQVQLKQSIKEIEEMTNAQQRFAKMLELTGLNYDDLYKKQYQEISSYNKDDLKKAKREMQLAERKESTEDYRRIPVQSLDWSDNQDLRVGLADYKVVCEVLKQYNQIVEDVAKTTKQQTIATEKSTRAVQETSKAQDNNHSQANQAVQDILNMSDAQERFNKILEFTKLNYDEVYKARKKHWEIDKTGWSTDEEWIEIRQSKKDEDIYNPLTYMGEPKGTDKKSRFDYVYEYSAKNKVLETFIKLIKEANEEQEEFINLKKEEANVNDVKKLDKSLENVKLSDKGNDILNSIMSKIAKQSSSVVNEEVSGVSKESLANQEKQTQAVKEEAQAIDGAKESRKQMAQVTEQETQAIKEQTVAEEAKAQAEAKSNEVKQKAQKVSAEELAQLKEQLKQNEIALSVEEDMLQNAKDDIAIEESKNAKLEERISKAKELKAQQEQQVSANEKINAQAKEENNLKEEAWKRIGKTITSLQEEKRLKEQMANDIKTQIMQEELLGSTSDKSLKRMKEHYEQLKSEAKSASSAIDAITKAMKNQEKATKASKNTGSLGLATVSGSGGKGTGGGSGSGGNNGGNNGGNRNQANQEKFINNELSERIKLKQRELMLNLQNLVYGKDLTDNQKLMVHELTEQIVALGKGVSSMRELNLEAQKVKQNMNETKFDVKVSTNEDKDVKKQLEEQRNAKLSMYREMFDELDKQEKKVREMENMYAKMFDQIERGEKAEERSRVILEDKVKKQRELWELKVKEFEKTELGSYADQNELQALKDMASDIGKSVTSMRELDAELHNINMLYKEMKNTAKDTKNTEAIDRETQALRELIARKEEDLRQTHQSITNNRVYREAIEEQRLEFDRLADQLRLTGNTTEEVNNQYRQLTQQMKGMKLNMVTEQLGRQETAFQKVVNAMKQYVVMNLDILDCFNHLQRGFSNAFEHVKTLDEAYTNISMTMNVTNEKFQTMIETAHEVGNANGQLATEVLNMMKVYANAGTTVEEINKQMKATVAFQNVTDMDATSVTNSIQTIIQQYKLLEDGMMDAAQATEYLGDVMVGVSYNLAKEESDAMQEVISGIETAGNMMQTSGASFEWFASVIGTLAELMNASGSETANAMKMIAARTLKSKEAIEELAESGEDMEDIEIAASNAELALNSIGLTARTQTGDMKDLQVVLGEVAEKWGGLTKATKQYVSEQLAGNNRRSYFIGLMENYERVEELQKIAENSSGALMEASDKKAKSLEGRLNTLQNSWARLYETMINSGTAKATVTALSTTINALVKAMENLHFTLPAVTTAVIAFKAAMNGWSIADQVQWIGLLAKEALTKLIAKLTAATGATNLLSLAMTALKTATIGAIVGGCVWAVGEYIKKVQEAKITTDDLTGAIGNLNNNYSSLMGALDTNYKGVVDYNEIVKANKELQTLKEGTEEYGEKQDFINQKLEELSHMYPEISEVLTTQLLPLERKLELLDQEIAKQQELAKLQAHDAFVDDKVDMNGLYNTVVGGAMDASNAERNKNRVSGGLFFNLEEEAKKYDEALEQIETAYTNALARMEMAKEYHELGIISDEEFASEEEYFNKLITLIESKEYASQIIKDTTEDVKDSVEETVEITKSLLPSLQGVFKEGYSADSWSDALDDLNEAMKDSTYTASEAEEAMGVLTKTFPEMRGHVNSLDEAIEYLANQTMLELSQKAGELNQILAEMGSEDFTGLDDSTLQNLLSMYPELGNHIQDNAYLQEFLNEKVKEYQTAVEDAAATGEEAWKNYYNNVLAYDSEFWNTKLKNTDEWATYEQGMQVAMRDFGAEILGIESQDFADYIDSKGGFREVDYSNCTNAAEAEALLQSSLLNDMLTWHGQYVNDKGGDRQTDMQNVAEFLSKQEITEATTVNDLKKMWSEYYNAKAKTIQAELKDLSGKIGKLAGDYGDLGNVDAATMNKFNNIRKQMRDLENSNNAMNNYFDSVNTALGGVSSSLTQYNTTANKIGNSIKGGNGYKPTSSGGSGNKGSGGSGNKGSGGSGSKATENVVEDLDLQIDKYQSLEEAINRVDEALARNAHRQEMVTNKADLKKLLEEEIQLMNNKKKALENLQKAQQKELNSVISDLKKSGFVFDGNELVKDGVTGGTVADRLLDAQNWANSATGSEKEWRKKDTLYLQEKINLYYELVGKVNDTNNEIDEMTLAIRKAKKEQEELLKAVENLADRYLQVTMKINRLDNELSLNKRKQELATGKDLVKLRERELEILAEKKLLNQQNINELKEEKDEIAKVLKDAGFKFSEDGTIANYDDKWKDKTDKYNTLAGYEAEDYKEYLDDLADKIERYLAILNNELPDAEENYYDIVEAEKEAMKQQEEYLKQLQELIDTYDRLFDITQKLTKANNELSLIEEKMQHASYEEKLKYLERQEEIYKSQLALLQQQAEVNKQIVNEKQHDLTNLGFEFDEDGYIKNYDDIVGEKLKEIEAMEGGAIRDEAIEDYNDLINKVEEYNNAMQNVADSEKQWWEVNNAIKDAQQEQLDIVKEIQDSIGNAITNRWEETTSKLKEELDKQKEMLNRQWNAEDWEDELADAQDELNKLQAQINNLSKDTSQAGQLKLQQLKEQYAEQLKAMNDMIKDHEREMTNQAFQDEADALDKQMEEALKVEELMKSVNEALATGFVTIGEEAIRLNDLLVDQLKEAKELWGDLTSLGLAITHKTPSASELSRSGGNTILPNNSAPLVSIEVMGNLDGTITRSDLDAVAKEACDLVIVKLNDIMK